MTSPAVLSLCLAAALSLPAAAARAGEPGAATAGFPAHALGNGPRVGKHYQLSRWAEDWSAPDPAADGDPFAPVKRIPLGGGLGHLTFNGQLRLRYNGIHAPGLRDAERIDQSLLRAHFGADLHLGEHLRLYGELTSAHADGTPDSGTTRNDLDWLMLFGEVRGTVGGATAGVRVGRQDFTDVSPVLFSRRESLNVPLTHNGVRAYAWGARLRVGAFDLRPTVGRTGRFDDARSRTERVRGVNASIALDEAGAHFLDPFAYRYTHTQKQWGPTTGRDRRDTLGLRSWGSAGRWQYDLTVAHQGGDYAGRDVSAWGVFAKADAAVGDGALKPRLGLRADYGSGGGSYTGGTLEAFNYGVGHSPYFADNNYLAPANLIDFAPTLSLQLTPSLRVNMEYALLRRADAQDAVYDGAGKAYAGTEAASGRDVGRLARLSGNWALSRHLSLSTFVNYLEAGDVLREAGHRDGFYVAVWGTYTF